METQIREAFGIALHVEPYPVPTVLPIYMISGRHFSKASFLGNHFLLISISEMDRFGVVALKKQLAKYMDATNLNAAYVFPSLTKTRRNALVSNGIPFLCLPDQVFLPFLAVAMNNQFRQQVKIRTNRFTPSAQCLFLFLLYNTRQKPLLKKDAAAALKLTRTSITRASEQLKSLHLITEEAKGTELRMQPVSSGHEYYEMAKPYLISPVARTITVKAPALTSKIYAGETALSMRTMLNSPAIPDIAIDKRQYKPLILNEVDEKWEPGEGLLHVELWKYDPALFSKDGIADPVSLAASLQDCSDERVQGELEKYMEECL